MSVHERFEHSYGVVPDRHALESDENEALIVAQLLQCLVRSRRQHLDEFFDGDGPYWTSIGLFIDGETNIVTTMERAMDFADESIETSRHILRQMVERGAAQRYTTENGIDAFRLAPEFAVQFGRYLEHQFRHVRNAWIGMNTRSFSPASVARAETPPVF